MNVAELIDALRQQPTNADVVYLHGGTTRRGLDIVYLATSGAVVLARRGDSVDSDSDRPHGAPASADDPHWLTPG